MNLDPDHAWLSVACPRCTYDVDFTMLQARLEETIYCPCCKSTIRLVDETASVEGGKRDIDNAMKELEQSLSKLNRTFKIRF